MSILDYIPYIGMLSKQARAEANVWQSRVCRLNIGQAILLRGHIHIHVDTHNVESTFWVGGWVFTLDSRRYDVARFITKVIKCSNTIEHLYFINYIIYNSPKGVIQHEVSRVSNLHRMRTIFRNFFFEDFIFPKAIFWERRPTFLIYSE